jgi:hypothetical protein
MTPGISTTATVAVRKAGIGKHGTDFVNASCNDLHETVQRINPTDTPRFANCCNVTRQEFRPGVDEIIFERAGDGPNFAIRYRLPR